jgi:hypothetical protein
VIFTTNRHSTPFIHTAYIPQGHRFNIFEDVGCFPAIYNTPPAYPLVWMWPLVISLISVSYCGKHTFGTFFAFDIQLFVSDGYPHPGAETG